MPEPPRDGIVAVIHRDGRFLWIKRGPGAVMPGYWAPPSGGVEEGEGPAETVVREMAEELGIEVRALRPVWRCPTEDGGYMLEWWLTEIVSGEPRAADEEVAAVCWVSAEEIHQLAPTFASHMHFIDEVWPTL